MRLSSSAGDAAAVAGAAAAAAAPGRSQLPSPDTTRAKPSSRRKEHPEDDDVLRSIRTVRRMVEREFSEAIRRRKRATVRSPNGLQKQRATTTRVGGGTAATDSAATTTNNSDAENEGLNVDSWKSQCFRLKQELFEAKNRSTAVAQKHREDLAQANQRTEEALAEAARERDMKDSLVETLGATTQHSEGISKQLAESRENSKALQVMWKDLVQTMEQEKESMDRERETSLRLLEETQRRLAEVSGRNEELVRRTRELESTVAPAAAAGTEQESSASIAEEKKSMERERRNSLRLLKETQQRFAEVAERNSQLVRREEELQSMCEKLTKEKEEASLTIRAGSKGAEAPRVPPPREEPPPFWDQTKTKSNLKQKLRELEEILAKDSEAIRSLENQLGSSKPTPSKTPVAVIEDSKGAESGGAVEFRRGPWTEEEKEMVARCHALGFSTYKEMSNFMKTRSTQQIRSYFNKHKRWVRDASKKYLVATESDSLATKQNELDQKKNQLRSKSLGVLEEVIPLQLQQLMELHRQTTLSVSDTVEPAGAKDDAEWKSIVQKLSQNRARALELRKKMGGSADRSEVATETKKRAGSGLEPQSGEGSPTKRSKIQK